MEPAETPCPVEGVVVPEKTRRRRPWFGRAAAAAAASSGSPAGVGATAEARKGLRSLVIYGTWAPPTMHPCDRRDVDGRVWVLGRPQ